MARVTGYPLMQRMAAAGLLPDPSDVSRVVIDIPCNDVMRIYVERVGTTDWVDTFLAAGLEVLTEAKIHDPDSG